MAYASQEIEFNTDVLDIDDRDNVDLSQFSREGYIMPGQYDMAVQINKSSLSSMPIDFLTTAQDKNKTFACIEHELVAKLGLKPEFLKSLRWIDQDRCLDMDSLEGMVARGDLPTATLYLSIPQAYLEYSTEYWDPPSRWDNGISGLIFDYNLNSRLQKHQSGQKNTDYSFSGFGTVGANLGAWRMRADWQARSNHDQEASEQQFDWNQVYVYRAIPKLRAKLTLGDDYLDSGIFDGFRYVGLSLKSDDSMLPPNLRGYAPEVRGVAQTNALVTISQQGRVLYETQVAAGPFRIQDLNDALSGELQIKVIEQDGHIQEFTVNTATIPYLTRPGLVRYKLAGGQPKKFDDTERDFDFATGEFSWGINNGWSLYGGLLASTDYQSAALGLGRDLLVLGAVSVDLTQARSQLSSQMTKNGNAYRLSYSKNFDQYDSQISFAGYRFSEQDFLSPTEFISARDDAELNDKNKKMYTISFNKNFREKGISLYANYFHQSYWNREASHRYDLTASRYFNVGRFHQLNLSLSAFRHENNRVTDDGITLTLSMPWKNATLNYNGSVIRGEQSHSVSYFNRVDNQNIYNLTAGTTDSDVNLSGYYNHEGDFSKLSSSVSYRENSNLAMNLGVQGGITLTPQGGALHRNNTFGATRVLLDTQGVAQIPVRSAGNSTFTNRFGKVVISDINSYYRTPLSIDLSRMGDHAEVVNSITQATLTDGAIGYRKFDVVAGAKAMAIVTLADGKFPPFGATIRNAKKQTIGLMEDQGRVYLSGIQENAQMTVQWGGEARCELQIPAQLDDDLMLDTLMLDCVPIQDQASSATASVAN